MSKLNNEEIEKIYLAVQRKAATSVEFRNELLADPRAAITKLTGKELPDAYKIKVVEKDPDYDATFVLPDLLGDEVDLDDLDNVAGGASAVLVVSACAAAVTFSNCAADACAAAVGGGGK